MFINGNYSALAEIVNHINNPNNKMGVLIEEIPADLGRSYEGYKRGGLIEGSEKLRKEVMAAIVWLFGIPFFNKAGNIFCEKVLKIPMDIDLSNTKEGNNSILDSINYLKTNKNPKNLDVSELKKYQTGKIQEKIKNLSTEAILKRIKSAKTITILASLVINCGLMGIVLPKINQKITEKKLSKNNVSKTMLKEQSIDKYIDSFKNNKQNLNFKGNIISLLQNYAYKLENNNRTRLVSTDVPMITGRAATSRNKYEALEFILMDGGSIFFYNYSLGLVQKMLRKIFPTPDINPKIAEDISKLNPKTIEDAIKDINKNSNIESLFKDKNLKDKYYKIGTFNKYGKINRFVKDEDLKQIDKSVVSLLEKISSNESIFKEGKIDQNELQKFIKRINKTNALYMIAGFVVSILGLASIMPKLTFWITKKITGKNTFAGITNYNNNEKK